MVEYPTDLRLDSQMDIYLDSSNDLATISGIEQLEQSVAMDVLDVTRQLIGEPVTGRTIGLLEERIERSLSNDEQVGEVRSIDIVEYNREDGVVVVDIAVSQDGDFTLEINT